MNRLRVGALFRCTTEPEELPASARQVEALGYDELWLVEDCFYAGGIASATAALARTDRITVGLGILPAVLRNPAAAAMELAALARLFPGRLQAGFGHGMADWMRQAGALPPSRLAALGETVTAVRALLDGQTVTLRGQHANLDAVRLDHPPHERPPVLAGVRGPRSLQLSGSVADGTILAELSSPGYVAWARAQIQAGRAGTASHRLVVYALLGIGTRGQEAVHASLTQHLAQGGSFQLGPEEMTSATAPRAPAADLPAVWAERVAVTGTPASCAAAIRRLQQAGADAVVLVPPPDPALATQQLEQAATQVLPAVR